tara:strand:+ start:3196 stop:3669 length:474 start_codon:yes stop_codon:yes gene_type:complete
MSWLSLIGNLFGIGKGYLENKAKLKQAKSDQEHEIVVAETKATVDRILNNTESDNLIDLITARNKKYTLKDEVLTYLFLTPVVVATLVPFFQAMSIDGNWTELNIYFKDSYETLDTLPQWYKYVLYAVVIDVLGFRSFARKLVDVYLNKKKTDNNLL